jgi:Cysteine-rich CPXCG
MAFLHFFPFFVFHFETVDRVVKLSAMKNSDTVQCPFCGQPNEIPIDSSVSHQRFTTDCEVCCRPFEVVVECEDGEILNLETSAN